MVHYQSGLRILGKIFKSLIVFHHALFGRKISSVIVTFQSGESSTQFRAYKWKFGESIKAPVLKITLVGAIR